MGSCTATIVAGGVLLAHGNSKLQTLGHRTDVKSLWQLGFGAVNTPSLLPSKGRSLIGNTLLANGAQVALSILFISYNSIFTCELSSQEWTAYAVKRRPLRVTSPQGIQRSTYFLQLPYIYSIPLLIASGTLQWLLSQSLFLAEVSVYDEQGNLDTSGSISTCGFSCIAIIYLLALGSLCITAGCLNGFRTYPSGIPLAGTCSVAISAACHPPVGDVDAAFKQVQYGEVESRDGVRHCTFTSHHVKPAVVGELYA